MQSLLPYRSTGRSAQKGILLSLPREVSLALQPGLVPRDT